MKGLSEPTIAPGKKGYRDYIKSLAHYVLVVILMIPECVRFNDILDYVVDHYETGASLNEYLAELTNEWSTLSKDILKYPTKFSDLNEEQKKNVQNLAVILDPDST